MHKIFPRADLASGFILFLIALPLSIGIAVASGAPPSAGIIAAVVGGVVGSIISGSHVTINGPAAGLTVIVIAAIQELGQGDPMLGFRLTLAATLVAGFLQICLGFLRIGTLGLAFPSAAIHGLLTAIGAIIIVKQFRVLLGMPGTSVDLSSINPVIAGIGIISLALLIAHSFTKTKSLRKIPAPLVAVVFGTLACLAMDLEHPHKIHMLYWDFVADPKYLLNIPPNLENYLVTPDLSLVFSASPLFWKHVIAITLVASIESILSAHAVDRLDPLRRKSNLNLELCAKGVCNMLCGAIGGLPIIAEIVRSSANIANGAQTRWANFFHGVFIFAFVALFPTILHEIPLAALAAILLLVGYRLAHPRNFMHALHMGWDQFAVFVTTFVFCLATDILVGVLVGFALELTLNALRTRQLRGLFRLRTYVKHDSERIYIAARGPIVFSNFLTLKKVIDKSLGKKNLEINLASAQLIDYTVREHLKRYQEEHQNTSFSFGLKLPDVSTHGINVR